MNLVETNEQVSPITLFERAIGFAPRNIDLEPMSEGESESVKNKAFYAFDEDLKNKVLEQMKFVLRKSYGLGAAGNIVENQAVLGNMERLKLTEFLMEVMGMEKFKEFEKELRENLEPVA